MFPLGDMAFYYSGANDLVCSETGDRRDLIYILRAYYWPGRRYLTTVQ